MVIIAVIEIATSYRFIGREAAIAVIEVAATQWRQFNYSVNIQDLLRT